MAYRLLLHHGSKHRAYLKPTVILGIGFPVTAMLVQVTRDHWIIERHRRNITVQYCTVPF